jgi:tight adherence protein B
LDLVGAACLAAAILSLGLAIPRVANRGRPGRLIERLRRHQQQRLAQARISVNPRRYLALSLLAPLLFFGIGWLESPVLAVFGAAGGFLMPRFYLAWLVHLQARRSEAEAPRLLQALLAGLTGGSSYLDALRQARLSSSDPWIREDLDFVIQRFLLDAPLHESLREIGSRTTTRNLGLIWETLTICAEHHLPTQAARSLFFELSSTIQFNVQLANEVRARSSGQRAQIWLLAVIVPAMYLYLHLTSPQLLSMLDQTVMGRFILLPIAAVLEVAGIALSFRIARFEA